VWISDITGVSITFEVYLYGKESEDSDEIPYSFSIFIAVIVGVIGILAFFPIGMLVYSHTTNFLSGRTTSEKFSRSGSRFADAKRPWHKNCIDMCFNSIDSETSKKATVKYNKDLEMTLNY
jgi:hypothetical protein